MDSTRVSAKEVINEVVEATNLEPDDSTECNYFFKELCCFSLVFVLKLILCAYLIQHVGLFLTKKIFYVITCYLY